ncbi:unnamed protein product [Prunus armeniaca]|uniref:Uncharacterized protein n=1 Tax=Prunus armeniaca TaxID=36596 RepID=A0A6J5USC4_PRUAR|nr:unnamed protein product [Prunus armeniaca]CAB4309915.1 unnamed protein product [Prunus armeniaca]
MQVSSPSTSASRGQSPWHDNPVYINKNTPSNHRASLEKDGSLGKIDLRKNVQGTPCLQKWMECMTWSGIKQLQLRLQQEKSMHNMLERAMGRASSTLSPGHWHFSVQASMSYLHVSADIVWK